MFWIKHILNPQDIVPKKTNFDKKRYTVVLFINGTNDHISKQEVLEFSLHKNDFKNIGCDIIAISGRSQTSFQDWFMDIQLDAGLSDGMELISDPKYSYARAFGVVKVEQSAGSDPHALFIIDSSQRICYHNAISTDIPYIPEEYLRLVSAFNATDTNQVLAPTDWKDQGNSVHNDNDSIKNFFSKRESGKVYIVEKEDKSGQKGVITEILHTGEEKKRPAKEEAITSTKKVSSNRIWIKTILPVCFIIGAIYVSRMLSIMSRKKKILQIYEHFGSFIFLFSIYFGYCFIVDLPTKLKVFRSLILLTIDGNYIPSCVPYIIQIIYSIHQNMKKQLKYALLESLKSIVRNRGGVEEEPEKEDKSAGAGVMTKKVSKWEEKKEPAKKGAITFIKNIFKNRMWIKIIITSSFIVGVIYADKILFIVSRKEKILQIDEYLISFKCLLVIYFGYCFLIDLPAKLPVFRHSILWTIDGNYIPEFIPYIIHIIYYIKENLQIQLKHVLIGLLRSTVRNTGEEYEKPEKNGTITGKEE